MPQGWSSFQESLQGLTNTILAQKQREQQFNEAIRMMMMEAQIKQQFDPEAQFRQQMLQMFQQPLQQPQQQIGGGFRPKSFTYGGFTMEKQPTEEEFQQGLQRKLQEQQALESQKGLSIETGGKLAMVSQAKKDIQEVRDMLFPEGTAKSFKRGLAFVSNLPGSRAPLIGAIIPQALPYAPWWAKASEQGQKIYSRLQNAVAAKLRVETGAQANPSEVENILRRFGITSASSPQAAWDALQRLEDFMNTTINITNPSGRFGISTNNQNQPQGQLMVDNQGNKAIVYPDGTYQEVQ